MAFDPTTGEGVDESSTAVNPHPEPPADNADQVLVEEILIEEILIEEISIDGMCGVY